MKSVNTSIFTAAAILLIISNPAFAYRPIIDLGTLGGNGSEALFINNNGQIVGFSYDSSNVLRPCLFDSTGRGANIDLGTLGDNTSWGWAYSINNNGRIVGQNNGACLFDSTGGGANITLGAGAAYSINNNGRIVGQSNGGACLFDSTGGGENINLGSLGGNPNLGTAYSINDNSQIIGWAFNNSNRYRACLFDSKGGGANINLGTLGGDWSKAFSNNNIGQIVGASTMNSGYSEHAVLFDPTGGGANIDLGSFGGYSGDSMAYSINDLGQIVGYANGPNNSYQHACFFDPTGQGNNIDLNTLINPSSGWTLIEAYGINNNGWIVGWGYDSHSSSSFSAFLITPEPVTLLLFALGGLALRRKR
jgi:probable HAF family extracellular repeat protein